MKLKTLLHIACAIIAFSSAFSSSTPATFSDSVTIGRFYDNKQGAVSYTFDDGIRNQFDSAVPVLNLYNIKGSFGIIVGPILATDAQAQAAYPDSAGGSASWHQILQADSMGHEICNHSWSHPNLPMIETNATVLDHQVNDSWDTLTSKLRKKCFSFFYPYNSVDSLVRAKVHEKHYLARENELGINGKVTATSMNTWVSNTAKNKSWQIFMIHGINRGFDALGSTALFRQHFAYVNTIRNSVWVATFGAVGRYVMERDSAHITAVRTGNMSATVNITCKLDTAAFNQPLTLIMPAPGAKIVSARQQGNNLVVPAKIDSNRIYVDVVPNGAPVLVEWTDKSTGLSPRGTGSLPVAGKWPHSTIIVAPSQIYPDGETFSLSGKRIAPGRSPSHAVFVIVK